MGMATSQVCASAAAKRGSTPWVISASAAAIAPSTSTALRLLATSRQFGQAQTGRGEVAVEQANALPPVVALRNLGSVSHRGAAHAVEVLCNQFEPLTVAVACRPEFGRVSVVECSDADDNGDQRGDAADRRRDVGDVGPAGHAFEATCLDWPGCERTWRSGRRCLGRYRARNDIPPRSPGRGRQGECHYNA
jgi:hypothetical protein